MKSPIQLSTGVANLLLVDLPEKAQQIFIEYEEGDDEGLLFYSVPTRKWTNGEFAFKILPEGIWQKIFWSDELTEEQAKGLGFENLQDFINWLAKNNQRSRKYILVKLK